MTCPSIIYVVQILRVKERDREWSSIGAYKHKKNAEIRVKELLASSSMEIDTRIIHLALVDWSK